MVFLVADWGLGSVIKGANRQNVRERVSGHFIAIPLDTPHLRGVGKAWEYSENVEPAVHISSRAASTYLGRGIPSVTPPVTPHLRGVGSVRTGKIGGRRAGDSSSRPTSTWSRCSTSGLRTILQDPASNKGCATNRNTALPATATQPTVATLVMCQKRERSHIYIPCILHGNR